MLTSQQKLYFQTFGFLVVRQLFSPEEMKTLNAEFTQRLESVHRDRPFDGTARQSASLMGPDTPCFASLMEDERFVTITAQLYGDDFMAAGLAVIATSPTPTGTPT